jgi:hypothetical protein
MSDENFNAGEETWGPDEDDAELEDASLDIFLNRTGEKGSGYHILNDPSAPYERTTVSEQTGAIDIRCKALCVVHGYYGGNSDDYATLLVYEFSFDAKKRASRVASVNIKFEFSSSVSGGKSPKVEVIAPQGRVSMLVTSQEESLTRGVGAELSSGLSGAVTLGGSYKWEKTVNRTTMDETRLVGARTCNSYGKEVGANWVILENDAMKTGVPPYLRAAILLTREDEEDFECKVAIDAKADWKTNMVRLFGSTDKDEPILYSPSRSTGKKRKTEYDIENLGSLDLGSLADVNFGTLMSDEKIRKSRE